MDDEEDEVFRPVSRCWGAPFREIKYEDRGTQTPSPVLSLQDAMLPCSVSEEPRRLFYGNAGFRLHFPALFEHVGEQERDRTPDRNPDQDQQWQEQHQEPSGLRSEVRIGRNLQLIGDQFHLECVRLVQYQRTQRNQQPIWWRAVMTACSLLFDRGGWVDYVRGVLR